MIDILKKISLLSGSLQVRNLNVTRADILMKGQYCIEIMKNVEDPYESNMDEMIASYALSNSKI